MTWSRQKLWLVLFAAATTVGLLEAAQVYTGAAAMGRPVPWLRALGATMPGWYVLLALVPAIIWMCRRFPLEPGRLGRRLPVHGLAAIVFALVHIGAAGWISDFVLYSARESGWNFMMNVSRLLGVYFVIELMTYAMVVGSYHAIAYGRRVAGREREAAQLALKASRLEASLATANLDALRMQLNPHFLFNTLNAISVLAMKGEREGVVRMLTLLSDLLRTSLENRHQMVSLRHELEFLDRYLAIEEVRFRDRLLVERDIDPEVLGAEVPSLILQPLVENAIGHGLSRQPGPGTIRISARVVDGEALELGVADSGPGFSKREGGRRGGGTGLGIANTRARLEQLYGQRQQLDLANRPAGGALVTVRIPLRLLGSELQPGPAAAPSPARV
jgi:two-component system, LytTR family, sensor kinase